MAEYEKKVREILQKQRQYRIISGQILARAVGI